jgi:hypothetical protein
MSTKRDVLRFRGQERTAAVVRTELERGLNWRWYVKVLHDDLGVPDEVIAGVAGVHPGSARRWRSTDQTIGDPRPAQARAIEQLRAIALILLESGTFYDLKGIGVWLQARQTGLGWKTPYEVLAVGARNQERAEETTNGEAPVGADGSDAFERVLQAAQAFIDPGAGLADGIVSDVVDPPELTLVAGFGPPLPDDAEA